MITSVIGVILGMGAIMLGHTLEGGHFDSLIQPTAAMIVFGGTIGATMLSSSLEEFTLALRNVPKIFLGGKHDLKKVVAEILEMASAARKEGILGLEGKLSQLKNPFFAKCLRYVIDGYDPNVVKEMMEDRMFKEEEEKMGIAGVWMTAGGYAPTIGILGAVLGLIHVMSNLSDSSKLGAGIAVAFVATIYGVGGANLILIPFANRMKKIFKEELVEMELICAGVVGIQAGLNPRVIEDRLNNIVGEHGGSHGNEKKAAQQTKKAA